MQAPRTFPPDDSDLPRPVDPTSADVIVAEWEPVDPHSPREPGTVQAWRFGREEPAPSGAPPRRYYPQIPVTHRLWLHAGLFALTALSCYSVGGAVYAAGLLGILFAHEMGHYLMARKWGVAASLPYFIPFPTIPYLVISPFGTMGAVITMKSPIPNRNALVDIGAAGPIAGFVVALVAVSLGLAWSNVVPLPPVWPPPGYFAYVFGDSLLFKGLQVVILGHVPEGFTVVLHPLAKAGWVGLFVTALNLLPLGQLDGGHVTYALFREHYRRIAIAATAALLALVFVSYLWLLFALMALVLGRRHPPPLDPYAPLDPMRRAVGYAAIVIFVLCFMPDPLQVVGL